jgi:hypothetical protein
MSGLPDISAFPARLKDMRDTILMIYFEKGLEPFKKPLLISASVLLLLYWFVYSPLRSRASVKAAELEKWETIAAHYSDYDDAAGRMAAYRSRLPLLKDKEDWLNFILTSTAKPYGIAFDSLSAQTEIEVGNFLLVSRAVTVSTTYAKFGRWLADIENTQILLRVTEVDIAKSPGRIGYIRADIKLSTIFPKYGGGGGKEGL